jgi:hypothetical protein
MTLGYDRGLSGGDAAGPTPNRGGQGSPFSSAQPVSADLTGVEVNDSSSPLAGSLDLQALAFLPGGPPNQADLASAQRGESPLEHDAGRIAKADPPNQGDASTIGKSDPPDQDARSRVRKEGVPAYDNHTALASDDLEPVARLSEGEPPWQTGEQQAHPASPEPGSREITQAHRETSGARPTTGDPPPESESVTSLVQVSYHRAKAQEAAPLDTMAREIPPPSQSF